MAFITTTSGEINYLLIDGDENKPFIIFLHEGLGSIEMWKDYPERLCNELGYRGLVYDRNGYGKSSPLIKDRTPTYLHEYSEELSEVINILLPNQEYILYGHSDGGSIALIHAAQNPKNLLGIYTEAAHVFVEQVTINGIVKAEEAWNKGKLKGLSKYHGDKTEVIFNAWCKTWQTSEFRDWNIENLIQSIVCSVYSVQGTQDQYGTKKQLKSIQTNVPSKVKTIMIDQCGHSPFKEQPEETISLFKQFINSL